MNIISSDLNKKSKNDLLNAEIQKVKWNRKDAEEALVCAISMRNWENVKKYASQLDALDRRLFELESMLSTNMFFGR